MDDLNRMLAETMHDAAGRAPSDAGLLGTVHERSRRHHRRRVVAVTATAVAVAVAVAAIPIVTVLAGRPDATVPPVASAPARPATPSAPAPPVTPSGNPPPSGVRSAPSPAETGTGAGALRLSPGWKAPVFPYTLPATDGMRAPVAGVRDGSPVAFFEATEQQRHADVTVTVSDHQPTVTGAAAETTMSVRGHAGTLRTVDVSPAKQLTLTWQESSSRWIQLATDDTYSPDEVTALADSMTAATIAVQPPFHLDLSPAGLVTDTVSASRMTFRRPGATPGDAGFRTVLRQRQKLTGVHRRINGYDAVLTRRAGEVVLSVDVTDWDATLEVTVDGGLTISDADLIRYAAGVRVLNRSDPE
jgi:hypothetical protein